MNTQRVLRTIWKLIPFVLLLAVPLDFNANACYGSTSRPETACGANQDNATNGLDVQQALNQVLGVTARAADVTKDSYCKVVDVRHVINAAVGRTCVSP